MAVERDNQDFSAEVKSQKRIERWKKGVPQDSNIEVDHIIPKYAGGTCDPNNAQGLTMPEHAAKHFTDAHDPNPGSNEQAEWSGTL